MAPSTSSASATLALLALLWAASRMLAASPDAHSAFELSRRRSSDVPVDGGPSVAPLAASLAADFPELVRIDDAGRIEVLHPPLP
eukprot:m.124659 g.124659  ORF g.124659 m.124659 type:complete len:85 (-) comp9677_c0_seq1:33-287(-)